MKIKQLLAVVMLIGMKGFCFARGSQENGGSGVEYEHLDESSSSAHKVTQEERNRNKGNATFKSGSGSKVEPIKPDAQAPKGGFFSRNPRRNDNQTAEKIAQESETQETVSTGEFDVTRVASKPKVKLFSRGTKLISEIEKESTKIKSIEPMEKAARSFLKLLVEKAPLEGEDFDRALATFEAIGKSNPTSDSGRALKTYCDLIAKELKKNAPDQKGMLKLASKNLEDNRFFIEKIALPYNPRFSVRDNLLEFDAEVSNFGDTLSDILGEKEFNDFVSSQKQQLVEQAGKHIKDNLSGFFPELPSFIKVRLIGLKAEEVVKQFGIVSEVEKNFSSHLKKYKDEDFSLTSQLREAGLPERETDEHRSDREIQETKDAYEASYSLVTPEPHTYAKRASLAYDALSTLRNDLQPLVDSGLITQQEAEKAVRSELKTS